MVPECTHILPSGQRCAQFALRGRPYCKPHMDPERRRRSEAYLDLVHGMATLDLLNLIKALIQITWMLKSKQIIAAHAALAYTGALDRLYDLQSQMEARMRQGSLTESQSQRNETLTGPPSVK